MKAMLGIEISRVGRRRIGMESAKGRQICQMRGLNRRRESAEVK